MRLAMKLGLLLSFVLAFTLVAACGDDDDDATPTPPPAATEVPDDDVDDEQVEAGRRLSQAQCLNCHSIDGREMVGPTWQGLYGSTVELEDGSTVVADEEYLRESILDPGAKIVKGYPPVMPSYDGTLTDEQVDSIIAYIRTIE
jgi:cytochrome c oxidase subunit II